MAIFFKGRFEGVWVVERNDNNPIAGLVGYTRGLGISKRCGWRASLIEDDEERLPVSTDGTVEFEVRPWEIVTMKIAI